MANPAGDMLVFGAGNIGRGLFGQLAAEAGRGAAFAATAVGGEHLPEIAPVLARGLRGRDRPLNVLVCENFPHVDRVLADALRAAGAGRGRSRGCRAPSNAWSVPSRARST